MSEYYMAYSGSELDEAISKVKNGYINASDIITNTKKSATGDIVGNGQAISNISITVGFKPKIFIIQNQDAVYTNSASTPYSLLGSVMICDDNYNPIEKRTSFVLKGDATNGWGRGGKSNTGFEPTENGVKGLVGSIKVHSGITYNWWAWG